MYPLKLKLTISVTVLTIATFALTLQGQHRVNTTVLDFRSADTSTAPHVVEATAYLNQFGITLSGITPGTQINIINNSFLYEGTAVVPTHPPNLMSQGGSNDPVSFTLNFSTPITSFSVTRPELVPGPSGVTHPMWKAHAFSERYAKGQEIGKAVGEDLISSYVNVPPSTFTLSGRQMRSVRFDSENRHFAAFGAVLLGELKFVSVTKTRL